MHGRFSCVILMHSEREMRESVPGWPGFLSSTYKMMMMNECAVLQRFTAYWYINT